LNDLSDPEVFKIGGARMEEEAFPFIENMIKLKAKWDKRNNNK